MGSASTGSGSVRKYARHSAAQWRALISEFEASGVSQQAFCTRHGLAKSTFELWRRKLRGARVDVAGVRPEALFVELTAPIVDKTEASPAAPAWEVELDLGAGVVLRLRRGAPC
jgi:putative transposase